MSTLVLTRAELGHPDEWLRFVNAIIARGALERWLGVNSRYGHASYRFGPDVHDWPEQFAEELAHLEDEVLEAQAALRQAQG